MVSSIPESTERSSFASAAGIRIGSILVLGAVAALLLWLLMERVAPASNIANVVADAEWRLLPLAVLLAAGNLVAGVLRWKFVLRAMGQGVGFVECLRVLLGVFPLVLLAPARSNELLRGLALRRTVPVPVGTGSVVVERVLDVLALLCLVVAGSLVGGWWPALGAALGGLLLLGLLAFGVAPRLTRQVEKGYGPRAAFRRLALAVGTGLGRPGRLGFAFAASLSAWLLACAMLYVLLAAFGSPLGWHVIFAAWPLAALAGTVPVTLAGMGTRDGAFLLVLAWLGAVPSNEAAVLAATLGYAALGIWLWVLTGLPFMLRLGILEMRIPADSPISEID